MILKTIKIDCMKILTVSQLNRAVSDYLEQGLGVVAVRGEVSEFRKTNIY